MRSSSSVLMPGTTCSPIMSSTSAASAPAMRSFCCSSGLFSVIWVVRSMVRGDAQTVVRVGGSWYKARPFLATSDAFRLRQHHGEAGTAAAQFARASRTRDRVFRAGSLACLNGIVLGDAREPTTREEYSHADRVDATDVGGGGSFRTSDPLLEPEDGALHLPRAQQDPHHQPREDAAAVRGRDRIHP